MSLWQKGPAAYGPYWRLSWVTSRSTRLQYHAGRGMAGPYGALWPCLFRDSGTGLYCGHAHPIAVMWVQSLVGAVLAGFWEPAFFMAGFWESAFFMAGFWESSFFGKVSEAGSPFGNRPWG